MAYNSKYTGQQVEALLDIVKQGGSSGGEGGTITEAELLAMGFTKNLGTITEVKMNGASKGTSGVVDLGKVITEHQDISGKQDKIDDLEDIREGASLGATALQTIPSEYVTESELTAKGYVTTSALNNKVDKVSGKGLSTEDFTSALKTKLEGLSNYDDATISNALNQLRTDFDTLVSGDTTNAIKSFNEIVAFLDGIEDSQDLSSIIASIEQQIGSKQDVISDLATIRSNASKVSSKQDIISDLATIRSGASLGATALQSVPAEYITETELTAKGYATTSQLSAKQDAISDLATIRTNASKGATAVQPSSLASVATSGSYNDLTNKPTIPSEVTEATISGWGFTKNSGTYSKPSTGIPASDLTVEVQTSLDKADTALQSYTEKYQGTVEAVDTNEEVDEPDIPQITENAVSTNRIIACVARFDGTQWNLINDEGHTPLNVTGISGTTEDEFTITFPAYSKVNSLVATPDETLAAGGIKCGASVGLDYATIRLRQDRLVRLYVATNANGNGGTVTRQEWDTRTDVSGFTVSIMQNTSLGDYIRIDDTKGNIDGSALPTVGGAFNTFLFGTKPGYINIQLRTADGNVSDYKNAEFQIGWPMLNVKPIFTSQEISKGNVWIYGIMEE